MIEKLFVYGTLGLGRPNEYILNEIGGTWESATVTGILKDEGWGSEMGYPAICLDDDGKEVDGWIFSSNNLSNYWHKLDEFEGEAYHRVLTNIKLNNGNMVSANIYTLRLKE